MWCKTGHVSNEMMGGYAVSTEDTMNINISGENKCKATMH